MESVTRLSQFSLTALGVGVWRPVAAFICDALRLWYQ